MDDGYQKHLSTTLSQHSLCFIIYPSKQSNSLSLSLFFFVEKRRRFFFPKKISQKSPTHKKIGGLFFVFCLGFCLKKRDDIFFSIIHTVLLLTELLKTPTAVCFRRCSKTKRRRWVVVVVVRMTMERRRRRNKWNRKSSSRRICTRS